MIRSHEAGSLRASSAGEQVRLAGWVARRRDHGGVVFIDLRDGSGIVQVVLREEDVAHDLRAEFCVLVTGTVQQRPAGNENPELATGEIEVAASALEVLSASEPLPFPIEGSAGQGGGDLNEEVRLRYRYLDIRRAEMAAALKARSKAVYLLNDVMDAHRFHTVETPFLTRSTPEGARDFLVPVRLRPGHWYALPQSPQLFKQLLMIGGPGALLPAGPLLPGRGLPGRPAARVHPGRPGDELRDQGRRRGGRRGPGAAAVGGDRRLPDSAPDPAHDLRRCHGPLRVRQARPQVRDRAHRPDRVLRAVGVPGVPGALRRRGRHAGRRQPDPPRARRLAGLGQVARRPRSGLRADRGGRPGL